MFDLAQFSEYAAFYQFSILLFLVAGLGFVAYFLKQPLILAYIAVGLAAGPSGLNLHHLGESIELFAELGIAVLLFIVGLKLDIKLIKSLGKMALIVGSIQMALTAGFGYLIAHLLGFAFIESLFIALALAFSSTIIIVKMLSDKKEIDSLHGRIALGVLIVQDFVVVLSMMVLATLGNTSGPGMSALISQIIYAAVFGTGLIIFMILFMKFAAFEVLKRAARAPELLLCFSLAWAVLFAALCSYAGLSKELGGLLAGISLASTPFREAIITRLGSVRDFLLLFFFILLGSKLQLSQFGAQFISATIFSVFVLLFKPAIIMLATKFLGYRKRTGFFAGLSLAQISEFSLILAAMGLSAGFISGEILSLITLIGLMTIAISAYLLSVSHQLYTAIEPLLGWFEKEQEYFEEDKSDQSFCKPAYDVILFGMGRYGRVIAQNLRKQNKTILVVDFNPDSLKIAHKNGFDAIYGDVTDSDFYHNLPLKNAKWVVSAVPQQRIGAMQEDPKHLLLKNLKSHNFEGHIAVATDREGSVESLSDMGASLVFLPFHDAAERAANMIRRWEEAQA